MISATVTGNITKDAENRAVGQDGVTSFSVASNARVKNEKVVQFVSCSIWGKRGSALQKYLLRGTPVTVIGELSFREHNGKTYTEMRVDHIELQGKGGASGSGGSGSSGGGTTRAPAPIDNSGGDDDNDIPFISNVSCDLNESWWRW